MAVGADVLDLRAAQLQRTAPGAGTDRHTQTAQADAAAVTLIPERRVHHAARKQEQQSHHQGIAQIVGKPRQHQHHVADDYARREPEILESQKQTAGYRGDRDQLAHEIGPVTHNSFDSFGRTKVPFPYRNRFRARNRTFAGRSAKRLIKYGYHALP